MSQVMDMNQHFLVSMHGITEHVKKFETDKIAIFVYAYYRYVLRGNTCIRLKSMWRRLLDKIGI